MTDNEDGHKGLDLVRRCLGESAVEEVCQEFDLNEADAALLRDLLSRWDPEASTQEQLALATEFADRPNLGKVIRALSLLAREAAEASEHRWDRRDN